MALGITLTSINIDLLLETKYQNLHSFDVAACESLWVEVLYQIIKYCVPYLYGLIEACTE